MRILMIGCGTSVGAYIRERLTEQGHEVLGVGRNGPDATWDFLKMDVEQGVAAVENAWIGRFGNREPNALINNLGMTAVDSTENYNVDAFMDVFRINVFVPYAVSRWFIKVKRQECSGRIINTVSIKYRAGMTQSHAYTSSKAALAQLTRSMAKEFAVANRPISIFGIAPGSIAGTNMQTFVAERLAAERGLDMKEALTLAALNPMGRPSTFEEVWRVYDFVVNRAPDCMTGSIIEIPQGYAG